MNIFDPTFLAIQFLNGLQLAALLFLLSIGLGGVRRVMGEKNPLERSYRLMREMGMPDEVFSRAGRLLRLREPVEVES